MKKILVEWDNIDGTVQETAYEAVQMRIEESGDLLIMEENEEVVAVHRKWTRCYVVRCDSTSGTNS